ncbi:hypothetical protein LJC47_02185 [Desulfosarcina sp. OttesenSCG-928-B08]|nr:hypothetical protein [Desulfosarcina sp. OttesenSCG-928-B08]
MLILENGYGTAFSMKNQPSAPMFSPDQMILINNAVAMAEELVSNHYKMSASQWLHPRYDVKTLADLTDDEVVSGPFAQILRYEGKPDGRVLGSSTYDFYKICIQDHAILAVLRSHPEIMLFPFSLYIITHELIHIVRFSRFLQSFDAAEPVRLAEEHRVHGITRDILGLVKIDGMAPVMAFYSLWNRSVDSLKSIF